MKGGHASESDGVWIAENEMSDWKHPFDRRKVNIAAERADICLHLLVKALSLIHGLRWRFSDAARRWPDLRRGKDNVTGYFQQQTS
jgi:hypothetical protein